MLTAKGTEYDKVVGLDSGADDYIPKPFGMMELVSRVRALLRRTGRRQRNDTCSAGPIHVDLNRHVVTVDGNVVALTFKEFELLCYLMENKGMVLTRDQLLSKIWGYDFDGETRTVDVHIRTLRQKLGGQPLYRDHPRSRLQAGGIGNMKIKRKIYWNLCLVALLAMALSALITAPAFMPGPTDPDAPVCYDRGSLPGPPWMCQGRVPCTFKEPG